MCYPTCYEYSTIQQAQTDADDNDNLSDDDNKEVADSNNKNNTETMHNADDTECF